jgi:hypothetical protein
MFDVVTVGAEGGAGGTAGCSCQAEARRAGGLSDDSDPAGLLPRWAGGDSGPFSIAAGGLAPGDSDP